MCRFQELESDLGHSGRIRINEIQNPTDPDIVPHRAPHNPTDFSMQRTFLMKLNLIMQVESTFISTLETLVLQLQREYCLSGNCIDGNRIANCWIGLQKVLDTDMHENSRSFNFLHGDYNYTEDLDVLTSMSLMGLQQIRIMREYSEGLRVLLKEKPLLDQAAEEAANVRVGDDGFAGIHGGLSIIQNLQHLIDVILSTY